MCIYTYTLYVLCICKHTVCMMYLLPSEDQGPKNVEGLGFTEVQCIFNLVSVADLKGIN